MKKTLILLFFLNACSSPSEVSKSDQIIVEENPGTTNYSIAYDDFELSGCELICIGERNFANSEWPFSKKFKNICERKSTDNVSINQFICASNPTYIGNSPITREEVTRSGVQFCDAYNKSKSETFEIQSVINNCNKFAIRWLRDHYKNVEFEIQRDQENYTNKLISYCDKIGFKTGTESNGNCVLRVLETQRELNEEKVSPSSTTIIVEKENNLNNSLLLMQMGLNLMKPPQPKLNCTTNLFGWTCY